MAANHIFVAGAVLYHWVEYSHPAHNNADSRRDTYGSTSVQGGAALLTTYLNHSSLLVNWKIDGVQTACKENAPLGKPHSLIACNCIDEQQGGLGYRINRVMNFQNPSRWCSPLHRELSPGISTLLVMIDSDAGIQDVQFGLEFFRTTPAGWCIYQMARPLARGAMWDRVRLGPVSQDGSQDPEHLIVVLDADDLRAEGIELSYHVSWEKVAEDFVDQLGSKARLGTLVTCAYLVVRFGCDGVILHRGRSGGAPLLFFDPKRLEGDFAHRHHGKMVELNTAFTAGFASQIAKDGVESIEKAIRLGFAAARRLATCGFHSTPGRQEPPSFEGTILCDLQPDREVAIVSVPAKAIGPGSLWSILDDMTVHGQEEIAWHIIQFGPNMALSRVPTSRFNDFATADRKEIENFQSVFNLIREYLAGTRQSRLRIGVFGPPGSGKLFATKQLAAAAIKDLHAQEFIFDLSQFSSADELSSAFQSIRDCNVTGSFPIVFFDNFDVELAGRPLGWLKFLLGSTLDGEFWENGRLRPLGPAIIFLIAAHQRTLREFSDIIEDINSMTDDFYSSYQYTDTEIQSGPPGLAHMSQRRTTINAAETYKFISTLHGFVNVLGPDRVDQDDHAFPIRRAMILRSLLEKREPRLRSGERIMIDETVLNGFLAVGSYRYGVHSMKRIIEMSAISGKYEFGHSSLPSEAQLGLHVDARVFMQMIRQPQLSQALRETIAQGLYEVYKGQRLKMAKDEQEQERLKQDPSFQQIWDDLRPELQESTRNQADDIPRKLRLINCYMARKINGWSRLERFSKEQLDLLSEREHERWVAERLRKQWHLGQRDPTERRSPFLVPWADLEKRFRDVDRAMVECVPRLLAEAGYHIYRLPGVDTA